MATSESGDTAHLYDGKTVRAAAPSRKKLASKGKSGTEIPEDAIPEVKVPGFVESLLGGPIVPRLKFLPADRMVKNLQIVGYTLLIILGLLTFVVTPAEGTIWYVVFGAGNAATIIHTLFVFSAIGIGFWGAFSRDPRWLLVSYILFIFVAMRFAASKISLGWGEAGFSADVDSSIWIQTGLIVAYAISLVMYFEITSGIIRFSMLDTSIRTNEVYVMNVKKIIKKYHRSLIINPVIAGILATLVLTVNTIVPFFVGIFSEESAFRMENSVELVSVYGVALGTLFVFVIVGLMFAVNLPLRIQQWRERSTD